MKPKRVYALTLKIKQRKMAKQTGASVEQE